MAATASEAPPTALYDQLYQLRRGKVGDHERPHKPVYYSAREISQSRPSPLPSFALAASSDNSYSNLGQFSAKRDNYFKPSPDQFHFRHSRSLNSINDSPTTFQKASIRTPIRQVPFRTQSIGSNSEMTTIDRTRAVNPDESSHTEIRKPDGVSLQLRPFFGYYGGKWRDSQKLYPTPRYTTIIEPFAGSAGFSLRHPDRKVILCEIDPILVGVWQYLIKVKPREILRIPDIEPGGSVNDLNIPQEAKWLVGFWLNRATASPRKSPSKWMRQRIRPGSFWGERVKQTIASQVEHIRHWTILHRSYQDIAISKSATWFIDPPYQNAGRYYRYNSSSIDYAELSEWCLARRGQVIVCENKGASWLPFWDLAETKTTRRDKRSKEVVWTNEAHKKVLD